MSCRRVLRGRGAGSQQGLRAPVVSCLPTPAFSVYWDKEVLAYLSLPWTGLLVCRGVEGPDISEEALHGTSWGDRGRVLCLLGPSLQDEGSGDSERKRRVEAEPGTGLCLAWLFFPLYLPNHISERSSALGTPHSSVPHLQMSRVLLGPAAWAVDTCPLLPLQGSRSSASWMVGRAGCPAKWSQPVGSGHQGCDTLCPRLQSRSCEAPDHMLGSNWELLLRSHMSPGQDSLDAHTCPLGTRYKSSLHALPRLPWVASGSCSQVLGHGDAHKLEPAGVVGARTAPGAEEACWPHSPTPLQLPSPAVTHTELWWAGPASPDKRGRNTGQAD